MKKIVALLIAVTLLISTSSVSFAADNTKGEKTDSVKIGEINEKDIAKPDIVFQSDKSNDKPKLRIATYYYACQVLETTTDPHKFVKYLTGSWAHASQYVWSQSVSTSWGVDSSCTAAVSDAIKAQVAVRLSYTATYGIAVTVPANSARYSKLGFFSDFTRKYVRTEKRFPRGGGNDLVVSVDYNYSYEPTSDTYLLVVYQ